VNTPPFIFGTVAIVFSIATLLFFSPASGSVWGGTFFDIPSYIAWWLVPLAAGLITICTALVIYRLNLSKKWPLLAGALVGGVSIVLYLFTHVALVALFGASDSLALLPPLLVVGGFVFIPLCALFGLLTSMVMRKLPWLKVTQ
jgi:hypothetical protein